MMANIKSEWYSIQIVQWETEFTVINCYLLLIVLYCSIYNTIKNSALSVFICTVNKPAL